MRANWGATWEHSLLWHEVAKDAAKAHPNWEATKDGHLRWLGGKGPRTPEGLLKWYLRENPDAPDQAAKRICAIDMFRGAAPCDLDEPSGELQ